jgi:hypothetical protein
MPKNNNFSVNTYSIISENSPAYVHWSEGLKMIIIKDGVTMRLNSEEIEQLVKAMKQFGETNHGTTW